MLDKVDMYCQEGLSVLIILSDVEVPSEVLRHIGRQ